MKRILLVFGIVLVFLVACSSDTTQKESENKANDEETSEGTTDEQDKEEEKPEETEDDRKKQVDAKPVTKREDQGDYSVTIEGDITYKDNTLFVTGSTNLLPGSKLFFYIDSMEGIIIGGTDTTLVNDDGTFEFSQKLPDGYDAPVIYTKIVFNSAASNEEITKHYTESGNPLEGPFVRLYEEDEEVRKEIVATAEVVLDQPETTVGIEPPIWEKPEDYGSPNVWIEAEVEEDDEFIYITGKSNLLEGSSVQGRLHLEGYITAGYSHRVNVNPDGSFNMLISHPMQKIKNLKGYEVRIGFSPSDSNNLSYIKETYGEKGENLQGDLVITENEEKAIELKLNVQY
ncbi:hypothetical protein ACLM5H_07585 [Fredinandcohnia humi]